MWPYPVVNGRRTVELSTNDDVVGAIDVGGTSIKTALVTYDGTIVCQGSVATPDNNIVDAIASVGERLDHEARRRSLRMRAVGVVTPGMVNEDDGVVLYASNLRWENVPLRSLLTARLHTLVAVAHDVRSAAYAEKASGACMGFSDFAFIQIGTGVAAAIVSAEQTINGYTGSAGEFGHIPVYPDGERCVCGQVGCLEVYASGAGVARRYQAQSGHTLTSQGIVEAVDIDPVAHTVWTDAITALACGITTLTLLFDPEAVVIGGGFAQAGDALTRPLRTAMRGRLAWRDPPRLLTSQLGTSASCLGAARLAFELVESEHPGMHV